jgi:hypothetical protein
MYCFPDLRGLFHIFYFLCLIIYVIYNFNTQVPCHHTALPLFFSFTNHSLAFSRQGAAGGKQHKHEPERRTRESRAVPAPDANAELVSSLQVILPLVETSMNCLFHL